VEFSATRAAQFSNLLITLTPRNEIARFTGSLPVYFGTHAYSIEFLPDQPLAEEIFAQTSRAIRAIGNAKTNQKRIVVNGRLSFSQHRLRFTVIKVSWKNGELALAAND